MRNSEKFELLEFSFAPFIAFIAKLTTTKFRTAGAVMGLQVPFGTRERIKYSYEGNSNEDETGSENPMKNLRSLICLLTFPSKFRVRSIQKYTTTMYPTEGTQRFERNNTDR